MPVFGEDPERYLNELGVTVPSAHDPERPAVLDAAHRSRLGHDTFFFATVEEKEAFDRDPLGQVLTMVGEISMVEEISDPVSRRRFRPGAGSPQVTHRDRVYVFESDSTRVLFAAMPDSFANPNYRMIRPEGRGSAPSSEPSTGGR